ncbi:hypothetical protein MLD38_030017 [Melastoma candidum]|uniref:Uncharacterized protein n=1 Tax=Melastoma candidum TaxID=119954 RepID=A0ACB9MMG1_9MYRT|nr:hypothetical protein MLD38_030017 [Melastoma candidum]
MVSSNVVVKVVSALVLLAFIASGSAVAEIPCNLVVQDLMPCVPYVLSGRQLTTACCGGVRSLYTAAKSTKDRQDVCGCLKNAIQSIPLTSNAARLAAGLPAQCKVNLPYKISPSTDCKSIK